MNIRNGENLLKINIRKMEYKREKRINIPKKDENKLNISPRRHYWLFKSLSFFLIFKLWFFFWITLNKDLFKKKF